jgi:hypothetical protein
MQAHITDVSERSPHRRLVCSAVSDGYAMPLSFCAPWLQVICEHRLQDKVWVRFSASKVSCTGAIKRSIHNTQEVGSTNRHVFWVSTAKAMRKHERNFSRAICRTGASDSLGSFGEVAGGF